MLKVKAEIALEFIRDILQLEYKPYIFRKQQCETCKLRYS